MRAPRHAPIAPVVGLGEVIALAESEARRRAWAEPVGGVFYAQGFGIFGVDFHRPDADHGSGGVGHKRLYFDGLDGRYLGDRLPWQGTAADLLVQAQFPLHSGRILGVPGRIMISVMGLGVAMLSLTGVYLWWKKRQARRISQRSRGRCTRTVDHGLRVFARPGSGGSEAGSAGLPDRTMTPIAKSSLIDGRPDPRLDR